MGQEIANTESPVIGLAVALARGSFDGMPLVD
jgi:hypothetical protein